MNKDRLYFISEILIIIVAVILYFIYIGIPDFKKNFGSSDKFLNTNKYANMVEFKINDLDFSLILNKEMKIEQMMFFTEKTCCLYNKNIENSNLGDGLVKIVNILKERNYLKNSEVMAVIFYEDKYKDKFESVLAKVLKEKEVFLNISYDKSSLLTKIKELDLDEDGLNYLSTIDIYSKNLCLNYKDDDKEIKSINEERSYIYASNVYSKIVKYYSENKSKNLNITLVPADDEGVIFPSIGSYYQIENDMVIAYIKFDDYDYCFLGSIDNYKKGVC